ncbi:hypothetical protein SD70_18095 [Gordoniibacillus kamchatkensis]|uniref:UspA domain-containing protein n=1 Tax=Gordoniibacillus kamchatkensis TaxID=1590651 RepID=A0ABR5AFP5_9BACL|nr:hypothetical protein SD70_18095 [Paenibacillus sp. VKM B-2647]
MHAGGPLSEELKLRLEAFKKLTVRLGGKFIVHEGQYAQKIAEVLRIKADEVEATQLVIGQSKLGFWEELWKGSVVNRLIRQSRHRDVLIVADYDPNLAL